MAVADDFVEEWNGRKLYAKYYAGLTGGSSLRRTKHHWGIRLGQPSFTMVSWCKDIVSGYQDNNLLILGQ